MMKGHLIFDKPLSIFIGISLLCIPKVPHEECFSHGPLGSGQETVAHYSQTTA